MQHCQKKKNLYKWKVLFSEISYLFILKDLLSPHSGQNSNSKNNFKQFLQWDKLMGVENPHSPNDIYSCSSIKWLQFYHLLSELKRETMGLTFVHKIYS